MPQTLAEQVMTVERALGERMIESALILVRAWMNELGENNPYEEAHAAIRKEYNDLFSQWLTSDDTSIDERIDALTCDAYQLIDAVYADLRLKRGLSPDMHGFNQESLSSVMNYFMNCVRLRPEDLEWLHKAMNDEERGMIAMMALSSLAVNLRECFSIDAMLALIEGINAENDLLANQCTAGVLKLLIQYDIRIDYFKQIQVAFCDAVREQNDGGEQVVNVLCALIEMSRKQLLNEGHAQARELKSMEDVPKVLEEIIQTTNLEDYRNAIIQWYPSTEMDFLEGLMRMLPETWLYHVLTEDNPEIERAIVRVLLQCGYHENLWEHPDIAEKVYRSQLRKKNKNPDDFIHYAHCLMLKGDRMMAYENYKRARELCKNVKDFYALFRPDRSMLVDHGVPVEQVYLIEDQLFLESNA